MATERRVIIEKNHWLPVHIDDGADAALIIVLLAGLGLIAYALFASHHTRSVMPDNSSAATSTSAPATSGGSNADTGATQ